MLQELSYEAQEYHFDRDEEKVKTLVLIWNPKHNTFKFSISDPTTIQSGQRGQSYHTLFESFIQYSSVRSCHCHYEIIHEKSLMPLRKPLVSSIYLRCTNSSEQSSMRLLCSKSRIAPIKRISIPRLKLCEAGLLSKLVKEVIASLKLEFDGV
ncbi:hypothetical protein TNCV_2919251 [Trichonephila clavipes]|nr:hypothetical protein TNCV_2919251 [Trichonephila clavipes]